jgi:CheY-like chemotaxis protein
VLVADADAQELRAIARELAVEHEVEAVTSLPAALSAIAERSFDLVLCDAGLPGGGGERFWQELLLRAPALQARVVFIVGGAERPTLAAFLARQPQPVLRRPFGLAEVQVTLDWLGVALEHGAPKAGGEPEARSTPVGRIRGG